MNQILNTNNKNEKIKKFFKMQLRISIILIIVGVIYIIKFLRKKENENNISNIISLNAKLNSVFSYYEVKENRIYFGRILCEKINLDYYIYNTYSEENLKILPCKFSGGDLGEDTNICIIGHNYFDNRFFSNLNELEIGDIITLKDLEENTYEYTVYEKYEANESDTEKVIENKIGRELTLCTCTYNKDFRLVIKAQNIR